MQLASPFGSPKIGPDNIRHVRGGSNEIGFINNSPFKNIFIFKLNAHPEHREQRSIYDRAAFAQKTKQQHPRNDRCGRMFFSYWDADASYFAPIPSQTTVKIPRKIPRRSETEIVDGRVPDKISRGGLSGVFGDNPDERLNIALSHLEKSDGRRVNIDISSDLRLPYTFAYLRQIPRGPPEKHSGEKKQSGKRTDEGAFIFVHEIKQRGEKASNPTGDWMYLIVMLWFLAPAAAAYWGIDWLVGIWFFCMGIFLLSAMLGLV